MQLKEGTLLQSGKYRIEKVLGQGGFGITYQAEQPSLRRKVAIKEFFMKEYCERDTDTSSVSLGTSGSKELVEKFREKFVKEAQNIASFSHNNIIKIYDVFEENNTAYYVMEYLDCGSLSDYLSDRGRLSEDESLNFIRQIADALSYIHEHRVNHLDVKPGNILLDKKQNAILIDFGLSKHYDERGGQTSSTPVGISRGYAPMEQYKQGGVSKFSPESDIYSLGATLYKMVTGVTPPEADDIYENGLSERIKQAITFAMQPKRKDRPQSVGEFLAVLDSKTFPKEDTYVEVKVKVEPEPELDPAPVPVPAPHPLPKRNWVILLIMAVVLCFGGYFVYEVIDGKKAEAAREEKEREEREAAQLAQAQKEAMLSDKREYLSLIGEGDKLQQQKKYSESINKYKQAQVYEEKYSSTVYSTEFKEDASAKIRAAEETERLEKERQQPGTAEYNRTHGSVNGHEWVDLGLSVKWATCNVGANSPGEHGNYYAWGETSTKSEYTADNSKTYCERMNDIGGKSQYDAARANWGGSWRLPTKAELEELKNKCTCKWTTQNGVKGSKVTGPNGNSIFLPAAGARSGSSLYSAGEKGWYWSSTPQYESSMNYSYSLDFLSGRQHVDWWYRYLGRSVRPVSE